METIGLSKKLANIYESTHCHNPYHRSVYICLVTYFIGQFIVYLFGYLLYRPIHCIFIWLLTLSANSLYICLVTYFIGQFIVYLFGYLLHRPIHCIFVWLLTLSANSLYICLVTYFIGQFIVYLFGYLLYRQFIVYLFGYLLDWPSHCIFVWLLT
jgi:hypothetical protein